MPGMQDKNNTPPLNVMKTESALCVPVISMAAVAFNKLQGKQIYIVN